MSRLPPFRTRRTPQVEPYVGLGDSRPDPVTVDEDDDDDAIPVLTQRIQTPAPPAARPEEPDEELVMRITDEVLDALQPTLVALVSDAVRKALAQAQSAK